MEQFVLYLAILAALSGFAMGLVNLAGPFLKRHNITLPALDIASFLHRGNLDEDDDLDLILGDDLIEDPITSGRSLLARRHLASGPDDDDEELDEELASVLEEVAEEEITSAVDDKLIDDPEDSTVVYTVPAQVDEDDDSEEQQDLPILDDVIANEIEDESGDKDDDDDEEDEEDDEEDDDDDDDEEEASELQTVSASGEGDDMMSFFGEAADAGAGAVAVWREDLPDVSIEELIAEARTIAQQIKGKKSNAA